jgi:homocysteine S-methyltransferase
MRQAAPEAVLSVMPNAGWPERVGGRILYPATPDYFADFARAFREAGASVIGGCCGTSPAHIAAMRRTLDEDVPVEHPRLSLAAAEPRPDRPPGVEGPTRLASRLAEGRFVIAVEVDPPRGFATQRLIAAARLLAEAGADVINVADRPMARMHMSPWVVCHLIQREVGLESVLHFPTRGCNLLRVQGDLLAAHALGTRNLLIVMGDPTAVGDYPEALDDYDLVPTGLIELVKRKFNAGVDHAGARIGAPTSFFVGCALNLCPPDLQREVALLHKKIAAGADFALTQPVYDGEEAKGFLDAYRARFGPPEIPILADILPLLNERHALFLHTRSLTSESRQPCSAEWHRRARTRGKKGCASPSIWLARWQARCRVST